MKKTLVLLALMAMLAPLWAQKTTADERRRELYREAMDLYGKQKYAAAQRIFDEIASGAQARTDLTMADACYFAGVCSEKLDNNDASYRLEEFLRIYPQSGRCNMARFYLGNFYYARADYEKALDWYRQVNAKEVEYNHRSEYNFKMGYCYFQKEDYKHASELFAQQVSGQSKYRNSSLYYYAHIQYMEGRYELALRNFLELESDSKFAKITPSYIARIYYYLGREDDLLQMAPSLLGDRDAFRRYEIHQMVGEIFFNRGEYAKALEHYRSVELLAKNEPTVVHSARQRLSDRLLLLSNRTLRFCRCPSGTQNRLQRQCGAERPLSFGRLLPPHGTEDGGSQHLPSGFEDELLPSHSGRCPLQLCQA